MVVDKIDFCDMVDMLFDKVGISQDKDSDEHVVNHSGRKAIVWDTWKIPGWHFTWRIDSTHRGLINSLGIYSEEGKLVPFDSEDIEFGGPYQDADPTKIVDMYFCDAVNRADFEKLLEQITI